MEENVVYVDADLAVFCLVGMTFTNQEYGRHFIWFGAPILPVDFCDFFQDFGERYHICDSHPFN